MYLFCYVELEMAVTRTRACSFTFIHLHVLPQVLRRLHHLAFFDSPHPADGGLGHFVLL